MLAALAVADLYNVARDKAVNALCKYRPLPHRCEKSRRNRGASPS